MFTLLFEVHKEPSGSFVSTIEVPGHLSKRKKSKWQNENAKWITTKRVMRTSMGASPLTTTSTTTTTAKYVYTKH